MVHKRETHRSINRLNLFRGTLGGGNKITIGVLLNSDKNVYSVDVERVKSYYEGVIQDIIYNLSISL